MSLSSTSFLVSSIVVLNLLSKAATVSALLSLTPASKSVNAVCSALAGASPSVLSVPAESLSASPLSVPATTVFSSLPSSSLVSLASSDSSSVCATSSVSSSSLPWSVAVFSLKDSGADNKPLGELLGLTRVKLKSLPKPRSMVPASFSTLMPPLYTAITNAPLLSCCTS